ncbi:ParA family protein [Teredinibacter turnerae]|uniref:ParA family protein n=1 Tax=Teredinibacter turnerae TaxID=2426 RepID=UPI00041FEC0B|nr:ParA family protein [Teredinibacter turnerae]
MNQIFIANPKGGCGKTTISTQIAGYYANLGHRVLLVDHDAQKSSSDWLASRPARCSSIQLRATTVETPVSDGEAEVVVHDMPAAWSLDHVVDIIHAGDKVLVPVLSSPTDIKACLRFLMELYRSGIFEAGIRMGMVANRSREHTRYYKILIEFLERLESPLVANLRDTQNYVRAMDRGLTIFDLPESRVAADLAQWQPIFDWLDVAPPANPIRTEEVLAG